MKIQKYLPLIIGAVIIIIMGVWLAVNKANDKAAKMIFFYGDTCPHCKNVEAFMAENKTKEKLSFTELEVYNNQVNAQLLGKTAKKCGLDTTQGVGVPFFYTGDKCLVGDTDIINYLKQQ